MANINNYAVTPGPAATITVPTFTITGTVTDNTGTVIADYTGTNALAFPACLAGMTTQQLAHLLNDLSLALTVIEIKAGLR